MIACHNHRVSIFDVAERWLRSIAMIGGERGGGSQHNARRCMKSLPYSKSESVRQVIRFFLETGRHSSYIL